MTIQKQINLHFIQIPIFFILLFFSSPDLHLI